MKALIFGISGQDGVYLSELLKSQSIKVIGLARRNGNWLIGDVAETAIVEALIRENKPDYIFHLAANSTTSHDVLFENHATISTGTLNILEAVYRYSQQSRVFISGSALQFANIGNPISEIDPFEAKSPYSVARIQSVYAARYFRSLGIKIYVGYFFHHDSPLRGEHHINMKIAKTVLRIKDGADEMMEIGNIDVVKEYNYAGDIVRAIWLLVNQDTIFETMIGSGKGYAIRDWLQICFGRIGRDWQPYVKIKQGYRPEFYKLVANPATLFSIGWTPTSDIYKLAEKMMDGKKYL